MRLSSLGAPLAHGAGFALQENNASGLGNAYAGGAAIAEDAATVWSNPAGMSRLTQREAVQAIHFIIPSNKFRDDGSVPALNQPLGNDGGDAGGLNVIPNLYAVLPYSKQLAFGLGINVPFGLTTEYDDGWIGRYHGIKSQVKTINVQPTVSWKVNDQFSVGLGIDYQWISARLTSDANYSAAIAQGAQQAAAAGQIPAAAIPGILAATGGLDSRVTVKGDDTAWGWNIGALYEFNPNTRVGVALPLGIQVRRARRRRFQPPRAAGAAARARAGDQCDHERRQSRLVQRRRARRHRAAADRQRIVLPPGQRPLGRDGATPNGPDGRR